MSDKQVVELTCEDLDLLRRVIERERAVKANAERIAAEAEKNYRKGYR